MKISSTNLNVPALIFAGLLGLICMTTTATAAVVTEHGVGVSSSELTSAQRKAAESDVLVAASLAIVAAEMTDALQACHGGCPCIAQITAEKGKDSKLVVNSCKACVKPCMEAHIKRTSK